jgi:UPF0716 family protein affecting phage T7 exclusion
VGVTALAAGVVGHAHAPLGVVRRIFAGVGALLLITPGLITDVVGLFAVTLALWPRKST